MSVSEQTTAASSGPLVVSGPDELRALAGRELGPTAAFVVSAEQVASFLAATGRRPAGAGDATAAGGQPAVPELLLLSLVNHVLPRLIDVQGFGMGVNYGTGEVRFPAPLAVGGEIRGSLLVRAVEEVPGGLQATHRVTLAAADG
ncbi:MAG: hypothetical protein IRZ08_07240, partial [Frankia sp.]|nr:hypothetical protein [Frankia sp.]